MEYDSILFMGMGDHSMAKCYDLHRRMAKCFYILSGLQQPPHYDRKLSEEEKAQEQRQIRRDEFEIETFVRDIVMALTGKSIIFCDPCEKDTTSLYAAAKNGPGHGIY